MRGASLPTNMPRGFEVKAAVLIPDAWGKSSDVDALKRKPGGVVS